MNLSALGNSVDNVGELFFVCFFFLPLLSPNSYHVIIAIIRTVTMIMTMILIMIVIMIMTIIIMIGIMIIAILFNHPICS